MSGPRTVISIIVLDQIRFLREKPTVEFCGIVEGGQPHAAVDVAVLDVEAAPGAQHVVAHTISPVAQLADGNATAQTARHTALRAHDDVTVARHAARVRVLSPARFRDKLGVTV